jgi:hypothetical protein
MLRIYDLLPDFSLTDRLTSLATANTNMDYSQIQNSTDLNIGTCTYILAHKR